MPFTELYPEEMSLSGGEDTIAWLRKWNHCDQEDKILLCEYHYNLMGDIMNLQDMIGRGDIDEKKEDKVGTIWEGTRTANKIDIQGTSLDIQDK